MQVKRYEAANVQEALMKIKRDMGPDAIVLSTKKLQGRPNYIEIMAARDNDQEANPLTSSCIEGEEVLNFSNEKELLKYFRSEIAELKSLVRETRRDPLHAEIAELKNSMTAFFDVIGLRGGAEHDTYSRIYYYLVSCGISKSRIYKLMDEIKRDYPLPKIKSYEMGLDIAERLLSGSIREVPADTGKRIKVFLGPTGVGKTTTLAKLAARYALDDKLSVGLITTDTYRIAAPEQLNVYARIMGVPLEVAGNKEQFQKSLKHFSTMDVVLVDTPGQSGADTGYISQLKDTISGEHSVEANLLLSLTSNREHLMEAVQRYGKFGCDAIIFTKLDECAKRGVLYDVVEQAGKPVSYVTNGQNVPKDIEKVNPPRLAELIMRH